MNGDIVVHQVMSSLTAADIKAQVDLIQQVMRAVMKRGVHYGIIPGCDKPSLYKPGAEKLLATFKISVEPEVQDLSTPDEARYRVLTRGVYRDTGVTVGIGVGECSSNEEKYKWREAICSQEFDETPDNRKRLKWKKKWLKKEEHYDYYQVKQVRTEIADVANTVLKIGKKRSQIDLCLTTTAASDIFTQDIEDMPEEVREGIVEDSGGTGDNPLPEGVLPCDNCRGPLGKDKMESDKVADWCRQKSEQYGGKMLCRNCQPKAPQRRSEKDNG